MNSIELCEKSYLSYAMQVILSRAIPDLSDGLKPVHRRVLYSMLQLGLYQNQKYKKSARIVGDVIGKYHPHGDAATYETMVRMAQPFSTRYPIVDGQGNFGSPDGDSAAAMRYTEARLTKFAEDVLLKDVDSDIVEFGDNYDNTDKEPLYLPARLPLSFVNGSSGIAVGLTSNVPSHNLSEIADALLAMISNEQISIEDLMDTVKGPDFPCGGHVINSKEHLLKVYSDGEGVINVICRNEFIDLGRGKWALKLFDFPPYCSIQKIEEAMSILANPKPNKGKKDLTKKQLEDKKLVLSLIEKVKSVSNSKGGSVTIVPKSSRQDKEQFLATIYKMLPLEQSVKFKLRHLQSDGKPTCIGFKESLQNWIDFRFGVMTKRTEKFLKKTLHRIHILEGRIIVKNNIQEVVDIVTNSEKPKEDLMEKIGLSEIQAEDTLETKLRSLAKLELNKIEKELKDKNKDKNYYEKLLNSKKAMFNLMKKEIIEIKDKYADERRTLIEEKKITAKAAVIEEKVTLIFSKEGWVTLRKGHGNDLSSFEFKVANDEISDVIECMSVDKINILASNGRTYTFKASEIPSGRGSYIHIQTLLGESGKGERVIDILISNEDKYLVYTSAGYGFVITSNKMETKVSNGKEVLTFVGEKSKVQKPQKIEEDSFIFIKSEEDKCLIFDAKEINELSKGKGVQLIKIKDKNNQVETLKTFSLSGGLKIKIGKDVMDINESTIDNFQQKRAQIGKNCSGKVTFK